MPLFSSRLSFMSIMNCNSPIPFHLHAPQHQTAAAAEEESTKIQFKKRQTTHHYPRPTESTAFSQDLFES
jgi:hypothetical protein